EELGDAAGGHRILRLGAAVLAAIAEIGRDGGHPRRSGIAQGGDEEEQAAELVVRALAAAGMERVDDEGMVAMQRCKRAGLALAILENPLLMGGERLLQALRHALAIGRRAVQGEQAEAFPSRHPCLLDSPAVAANLPDGTPGCDLDPD